MSPAYKIGKLTRKRADGSTYWSYCIHWRAEGKRQRFSLGTTDGVTAGAIARRVWDRLTAAQGIDTVGDVVMAYLGPAEAPRAVPDAKRKREAWRAAAPYWASVRLSVMDEVASLQYPAWRKRSANTHRQELSLIRTALRWAERGGLLPRHRRSPCPLCLRHRWGI